ncbi:MAG: type IV toxin-antitoxin system AbiEi family antitoxin [Gammaproteobacteria bacterium]|nr:type IV toxin-antitoxin system AbiEi family antitoxin [Gammaproteobacteria bacterium]
MCAFKTTTARDLVVEFAARGQYHFTSSEFRSALGVSVAAANQSLWRLAKRGEIASPGRGFYVIVPPEYRALGCLPPDQFIPALMDHRRIPYYAGLLSAAQYHGAAHHRPQVFQVMVDRSRPAISCGAVQVDFISRAGLADVPLCTFDNPRGTIAASTVEATAVDLVGYMGRAGGVDRVAGMLLELSEQMDPVLLVDAARSAPALWAQRLGFLLEFVGAGQVCAPLRDHVRQSGRSYTRLLPSTSSQGAVRSREWRLVVNAPIEVEA